MPEAASNLPSNMEARRQQLLADEAARNNPDPTPTPTPTPTPSDPAPTPTPSDPAPTPTDNSSDRVTLTREELNALQARADLSDRNAELLELERAERLEQERRLTDPAAPSKGTRQGDPSAPEGSGTQVEIEAPSYSEDEEKEFGESKPYIRKVVMEILREVLPKVTTQIDGQIENVRKVVSETNSTVRRSTASMFNDRVLQKLPDRDALVSSPHWKAFLASKNNLVNRSYEQLLAYNVQEGNVDGVVEIFDKFRERYGIAKANTSAYAGAVPTGVTTSQQNPAEKKTYKMSERKEMSRKYHNGNITIEELDAFKAEFNKADSEGRVDYNN